MFKKTFAVLLAVVLCFGCFSMVSFAAFDDVKIIRSLNSNYSMTKVYDMGVWEAYALADPNGNAYYYENNPINENGVYRAVEKNVDNKGEWYADMTGRGTKDKKNGIGESFDSDYPFSWSYDHLHIALKYNGNFYYKNGTALNDSGLNAMASLGDVYEVIYMNHNLVFPVEFPGSDIELYTIEEVCADVLTLYAGDTAEIYFEDGDGKTISNVTVTNGSTSIANYSNGKLKGVGAGETALKVKFTKNGRTVEKSFRIVVKSPNGGASAGFRCSKCDWYDSMIKKGGISAVLAKIVHPVTHALEQMFKR